MPRHPPDFRGARVLLAVERGNACPGDSEQELQLFHVVKKTPGYEDVVNISDALEIYRNQESRHVFNALILAKATDGEISEALDVPEFILPVYRWLFFDRYQKPRGPKCPSPQALLPRILRRRPRPSGRLFSRPPPRRAP